MDKYYYFGSTDIGYKRTINEDYVDVVQFAEDCIFAVLADGMGSKPVDIQPAQLAAGSVIRQLKIIYNDDKGFLFDNAEQVLQQLLRSAGELIGAFRTANEELYAGYATTLTCCLLTPDKRMISAHLGNSRIYLIRNRKGVSGIRQISTDHTVARELCDRNIIGEEEYYTHPDRNKLTSVLGISSDPYIQVIEAPIKDNDILLLTSDGIHYAVRPEAMLDIVIGSDNCKSAVDNLIFAAKSQKYNDNMSAIVIYIK